MKIPSVFTERKEMFYFFVSVLLCAILFVVVYNPIGFVEHWNIPQPWNGKIYITLLVLIGFVLMVGFRSIVFLIQKRNSLTFSFYIYWAVGELIAITFLLSAVSYGLTQGDKPYYLILGLTFLDVITVLFIPYFIVALVFIIRARNREIAVLSSKLALLSNKFISLSDNKSELPIMDSSATLNNETLNFYDRSGRFVFSTHANNVLYVESADNYCNIHYINDNREDYYILHNSMKNVNETYADKGLLRCHRCYMVNVGKVKLVKKVKDGLVLELSDTEKVVPVSKTYNDIVVKQFVK